jgi:hypothetical protein
MNTIEPRGPLDNRPVNVRVLRSFWCNLERVFYVVIATFGLCGIALIVEALQAIARK